MTLTMNTRNHLISKLARTVLLLMLGCLSASLALAASPPTVTATLDPDRIAAGDTTTFTVTVSGTQSAPRPEIPEVDDLEFYPAGQSSRFQSINGRSSVSIGYQFTVLARSEGRFEIPAIAINIDGRRLQSEPVTLTVSKGSPQPVPATQPPGLTTSPSQGIANTEAVARLTLTLPDRNTDSAYVGELIPIKLEAWFREGAQVSLTSKPTIDGQAFTLHNISDEPKQDVQLVNGEPYRVLTWYGGLSAVKAGKYPVDIRLDATVAVRQQRSHGSSRRPQGLGRLSDPLFDHFLEGAFDDFFAPMVEKEIKLTAGEHTLDVQPLPEAGRPENFSGAVGQFEIRSFSLPASAKTGEPVKVRVSVEGSGNFDRVSCPDLEPGDSWKTYQPKSDFNSHDAAGFQGSKTFEQNAVPKQPGTVETRFAFAYFDPKSGKYATAEGESVPLTITGNPLAGAVEPTGENPDSALEAPTPTGGPASNSGTNNTHTGLAPLKLESSRAVNLTPLYQRPWFLVLQGALVSMIITGVVVERVRRRTRNPESIAARETQRRLDKALEAVDHARLKADSKAFFIAARNTLQIRAGSVSARNPETLTGADLAIGSTARQFFELADAAEYSHVSVDPEQLPRWRSKLDTAMDELQVNAGVIQHSQHSQHS